MRGWGGKNGNNRGQILYDTEILLQEDGGEERSLRWRDRDLAPVSRCLRGPLLTLSVVHSKHS